MTNTEDFLNKLNDEWKSLLPTLKMEALDAFEQNKFEINYTQLDFSNIPKGFGIYLFQIFPYSKFNPENFESEWKSIDAPKHSPNISTSRFKSFDRTDKWFPFYLGKSENLRNRIKEHCVQDSEKTTYSLKLRHRHSLLSKAKFVYSYFEITSSIRFDKCLKQFIITNLEKDIRDEIKPWIGKQ